jgi:polyhydroxyalkanoate synthase subunit PhaE
MAATKSAQGTADWQQYWDNWFQGQRTLLDQQLKSAADIQNQWSGFFKEWQNSMGPSQPHAGAYQQFFVQAGQQYLDMMQHFYEASGQNKPVGDMASEWLHTLQQFFLQMLQSNTQPIDVNEVYKNVTEAFTKGSSAWTQAFQTGGPFAAGWNPQGWNAWQGAGNPMGGMGGMGANPMGWNPQGWGAPGLNTSAWNPQAAFQAFDPFGFYASLPGIGYTREKQDDWSHLYKLWTHFNAEVRKYNAGMAQVGLEAIHDFQDYVANPPQDAAPLKSLKEVYGKWVDICEEVYAKYAVSEEYTKLYGEVVNALMAYKGQANKLMDDLAGQFNLPTRTEVDSLHQRLHALRRDNIELRKAIDEIRGTKTKTKPAGAKQAPAKSSKKGEKK